MSIVGKPLNNYQKCIDACLRCFQVCYERTALCLQEPDVAQRTNYIGMMLECTDFCQGVAYLIITSAKYAKGTCQLCTAIYEECAAGCARFRGEYCQQRADECRKCVAECKAI